jgi:V-type H+-transporting ATPase subunit a
MFGDIGHGLMLFLSGAFLCFGGRYAEATGSVYSARYLLVLLGTFAIYTGFVYNDFMAIPLETFGPSCYDTKTLIDGTKDVTLKPDCVYPFGIDPKWY